MADPFMDIIRGRSPPDPVALQRGADDHRAGKAFHECPFKPDNSPEALSWRIGWNDRALEHRDG